jgi:hypothetical protein
MVNITIVFKVHDELAGGVALGVDLHEALCCALHEGDPKALAWLMDHVVDVGKPTLTLGEQLEQLEKEVAKMTAEEIRERLVALKEAEAKNVDATKL